jgi:hypothetical protein
MPPPARLAFDAAVRDGGAALRAALQQHGYAHVTGVVPPETCDAWAADLRAFIASLGFPGARFDDPHSVAQPDLWPPECAQGVFGGYGAGACTCAAAMHDDGGGSRRCLLDRALARALAASAAAA